MNEAINPIIGLRIDKFAEIVESLNYDTDFRIKSVNDPSVIPKEIKKDDLSLLSLSQLTSLTLSNSAEERYGMVDKEVKDAIKTIHDNISTIVNDASGLELYNRHLGL